MHSLAQALTVVKEKVGREYLQVQRATIALADEAVDADLRRLDASDVQIRGPFLEGFDRSEEHTSELQSPCNLVCRLLLEKKKNKTKIQIRTEMRDENIDVL